MTAFSWVLLAHGPFGTRVLESSLAEGWPPSAVMCRTIASDLEARSVADIARTAGIPLSAEDPNSPSGLRFLEVSKPDVLFTVNYPLVLSAAAMRCASDLCLNIHDSLLPTLRGRSPLTWSIIQGHQETGVTVHRMEETVDTGDILLQDRIPIALTDTCASIMDSMLERYPAMVRRSLKEVREGTATFRPQVGEVTYGVRRRPEDGRIDWAASSREIFDWVRALTRPYPGAFTMFGDEKVPIWRVSTIAIAGNEAPGTVVGTAYSLVGGQVPVIRCGDGLVLLEDFDGDGKLFSTRTGT